MDALVYHPAQKTDRDFRPIGLQVNSALWHSQYMTRYITVPLVATLFLLSSCTALNKMAAEQDAQAKASFVQSYCSAEGGYALGMNDAKDNRKMRPTPAALCNPGIRAKMARNYQRGYSAGMADRPAKINVIIHNNHHKHAKRECHTDAYGNQKCGYNCAKDNFGNWYCAKKSSHNCVINTYAQGKCGKNCTVDTFGNFHCE